MNATLGQSVVWNAVTGAHYDVALYDNTDAFIKSVDTGATPSIVVGDLVAGQTGTIFLVRVRSKNPDGSLPSAWSAPISITIVGFAVPDGLTVV